MNKREFLGAATLGGTVPLLGQNVVSAAPEPAVLTVTGAIARTNRARFDPALDQLMHKQHVSFERAFSFDYARLARLPAVTITATLEYDARAHQLRGPLLLDVLAVCGAQLTDTGTLILRAVDGFAVSVSVGKARRQRLMVATLLDGKPMPLGGLGPLWAVVDADRIAELATLPLAARFGACPWGLYYVEVQA